MEIPLDALFGAPEPTIRDVPGILAGNATDSVGMTGCTVVIAPGGAVAGVDVRGSAPGTRETDVLMPTGIVERINAICLAGGSAFGLGAADGVMRFLAERGAGFATGMRPVPIVPAAIIFDLAVGSAEAVPGPDAGYAACVAAERADVPIEGRAGAGTGATIGKLLGMDRSSPGGVGSAAIQLPDGTWVGALVVNNAMGNVIGRDGRIVAGMRADDGGFLDATRILLSAPAGPPPPAGPGGGLEGGTEGGANGGPAGGQPGQVEPPPAGTNTVLVVVATDATLDRSACRKLAEVAHDGLALSVSPVHTLLDGDTTFALATCRRPPPAGMPAYLQLHAATVEAVRNAVERSALVASPTSSD